MIANSYPFVKLNYTLPPEQLVIDLINNDNGTQFKVGQIIFGIPRLVYNCRHNTSVKVTASKESYWSGSTILHYNRIDIDDVAHGKSKEFEITTETKLSDLMPAINSRYHLKLNDTDYIDVPLPLFRNIPNEEYPVILEVSDVSLVFIEKLILKVSKAGQLILSIVLKNTILDGLIYTKPQLHPLIDY